MVYHTEMVARAPARALVVARPAVRELSGLAEQALLSAGAVPEGDAGPGGEARRGAARWPPRSAALVEAGIPVMGHVGLTPQSVRKLGGFKVQRDGTRSLAEARAVADAGAFAIVLECVPAEIADRITAALAIPTIGIGAGPKCDGQVLVLPDMLGLFEGFRPKFVRRYAELGDAIRQAAAAYVADVGAGRFPGASESFQ